MWFEDGEGTRLDLALRFDSFTPVVGELPSARAPLQFPDNFPDKAFYFAAEAELSRRWERHGWPGARDHGVGAAFGGAGSPSADANVVFTRLGVRIDDAAPGGA
jgi:hypothetical protein